MTTSEPGSNVGELRTVTVHGRAIALLRRSPSEGIASLARGGQLRDHACGLRRPRGPSPVREERAGRP